MYLAYLIKWFYMPLRICVETWNMKHELSNSRCRAVFWDVRFPEAITEWTYAIKRPLGMYVFSPLWYLWNKKQETNAVEQPIGVCDFSDAVWNTNIWLFVLFGISMCWLICVQLCCVINVILDDKLWCGFVCDSWWQAYCKYYSIASLVLYKLFLYRHVNKVFKITRFII